MGKSERLQVLVELCRRVYKNDLANSTLIPIENKAYYSVTLILDDLQDIIEKIDSGIVSALQACKEI